MLCFGRDLTELTKTICYLESAARWVRISERVVLAQMNGSWCNNWSTKNRSNIGKNHTN